MDEVDRQIVEILRVDGRASHAAISRQLGVSEGTVRRRLARLLDEGFIRVVAIPEPEQLGFHTSASIGLKVDPARVEEVADQLTQMTETERVSITTGSYDIFISVSMPSAEALAAFLHHKVGVIPGVRQTETFVNLEQRKRGMGPSLS
jgi:Lrp/AsnC family transcriptional regulator for asnA, asnC and gidA